MMIQARLLPLRKVAKVVRGFISTPLNMPKKVGLFAVVAGAETVPSVILTLPKTYKNEYGYCRSGITATGLKDTYQLIWQNVSVVSNETYISLV